MSHGSGNRSNKVSDAQGTKWVIVAYDPRDYAWIKASSPVAFCCALEEGTENQKQHYQIYARWASNKRWSWFQRSAIKTDDGSYSLHWELAKGKEWKCRRYIVDVKSYLDSSDCTHQKTQGRVLDDFGCEIILDEHAPQDQKVVKALVEGAQLHEIFRDNPMFYFHNRRKIVELKNDLREWSLEGRHFNPSKYDDRAKYKSKRAKLGDKDVDCERTEASTSCVDSSSSLETS